MVTNIWGPLVKTMQNSLNHFCIFSVKLFQNKMLNRHQQKDLTAAPLPAPSLSWTLWWSISLFLLLPDFSQTKQNKAARVIPLKHESAPSAQALQCLFIALRRKAIVQTGTCEAARSSSHTRQARSWGPLRWLSPRPGTPRHCPPGDTSMAPCLALGLYPNATCSARTSWAMLSQILSPSLVISLSYLILASLPSSCISHIRYISQMYLVCLVSPTKMQAAGGLVFCLFCPLLYPSA